MKRLIIFDPYLDTSGGGERYSFQIAYALEKRGWEINIAWKDKSILKSANHMFGFETEKWKVDTVNYRLFSMSGKVAEKYRMQRQYNLVFFLSDGSVPFLFGQRNWLHFQVPFHHLYFHPLIARLKMSKINRIICNSQFTAGVIRQHYPVGDKLVVVYPPVSDFGLVDRRKKKNMILSVGRLDEGLHSKRQDILVQAFVKMVRDGLCNWRLVLIGGVKDQSRVDQLKSATADCPVDILPNATFTTLVQYLKQAKIYWHAAGYEIDEQTHPEKVEHFGIAIAEAMNAGCVPVVVGKGGIKEIIVAGQSGYFWETESELISQTRQLICAENTLEKASAAARQRARLFSVHTFNRKILKLLDESYL